MFPILFNPTKPFLFSFLFKEYFFKLFLLSILYNLYSLNLLFGLFVFFSSSEVSNSNFIIFLLFEIFLIFFRGIEDWEFDISLVKKSKKSPFLFFENSIINILYCNSWIWKFWDIFSKNKFPDILFPSFIFEIFL